MMLLLFRVMGRIGLFFRICVVGNVLGRGWETPSSVDLPFIL